MHSSLDATAAQAAGGGHSSNNGAAAATAVGAPPDGAGGPACELLYNEPEDPTGTRQTLIQVCMCMCVYMSMQRGSRVTFNNTWARRVVDQKKDAPAKGYPVLDLVSCSCCCGRCLASKQRGAGSQTKGVTVGTLCAVISSPACQT